MGTCRQRHWPYLANWEETSETSVKERELEELAVKEIRITARKVIPHLLQTLSIQQSLEQEGDVFSSILENTLKFR